MLAALIALFVGLQLRGSPEHPRSHQSHVGGGAGVDVVAGGHRRESGDQGLADGRFGLGRLDAGIVLKE